MYSLINQYAQTIVNAIAMMHSHVSEYEWLLEKVGEVTTPARGNLTLRSAVQQSTKRDRLAPIPSRESRAETHEHGRNCNTRSAGQRRPSGLGGRDAEPALRAGRVETGPNCLQIDLRLARHSILVSNNFHFRR